MQHLSSARARGTQLCLFDFTRLGAAYHPHAHAELNRLNNKIISLCFSLPSACVRGTERCLAPYLDRLLTLAIRVRTRNQARAKNPIQEQDTLFIRVRTQTAIFNLSKSSDDYSLSIRAHTRK